jgi:cellulase/cellobiase CelA1
MKNCFKAIIRLCVVFYGILLFACLHFTTEAAAAYEPVKLPKVKSFTASSTSVAEGETVILKWQVLNAESIRITGMEKENNEILPLQGSIEVWPAKTTTYTLTAVSAGKTAVKSITVNVSKVEDVTIDYFEASEIQVVQGNTFKLSWKTTNAKSICITGMEKIEEELILPLTGSLEMLPTATTTYVLEAVGYNNITVRESLTVEVISEGGNISLVLEPHINDWGYEYIINFDIINTSDKTVNDWTLMFKKSEFDIRIIWGAVMSDYGDTIYIRPLYYNGTINPKGKVSFGIQAVGSPVPGFYYKFDMETAN